jgi:hypothetical protein
MVGLDAFFGYFITYTISDLPKIVEDYAHR